MNHHRIYFGIAVLAVLTLTSFAQSQPKHDAKPEKKFEIVDVKSAGGVISGMAVQNHLIFLRRERGLEIVDFSAPVRPTLLSRMDMPHRITDIAVSGPAAYVGVSRDGVHMIDVSNPRAPVERGLITSETLQIHLQIKGAYLSVYPHYKGDGEVQYLRIDGNPWQPHYEWDEHPEHTDRYAFVGGAVLWMQSYWEQKESTLLVRSVGGAKWEPALHFPPADGHSGQARLMVDGRWGAVLMQHKLYLLDLTNPLKPVVNGELTSDELVNSVATTGCFAKDFLLIKGYSPRLIDIADPKHPRVTKWKSTDLIDHAWVAGNALLIRRAIDDPQWHHGFRYRLSAIDLSNPIDPREHPVPIDIADHRLDVSVNGNMAYVLVNDELKALDCSDPKAIRARGKIGGLTPPNADWYNDCKMATRGSLVFIADQEGVQAINFSDPDRPSIIGTYQAAAQNAASIALAAAPAGKKITWVANESGRLEAIDMSKPAGSELIGWIDLDEKPNDMKILGDFAYVAAGEQIFVVDIRRPEALAVYNVLELDAQAKQVAVTQKFLFVSGEERGLSIYDLKNPASPQKIGEYAPKADLDGIAARGDLVYIANTDLEIVSVADPAHPRVVGRLAHNDSEKNYFRPTHVVLGGNTAYTPQLVDISNPAAPRKVEVFIANTFEGECLACAGRFVYVIDRQSWSGGTDYTLTLYDAVDMLHPVKSADYTNLIGTRTLAADEAGNMFIADGIGGILQLRATENTTPAR